MSKLPRVSVGVDGSVQVIDWEFVTYLLKFVKMHELNQIFNIRFYMSLVTKTFRNHTTPVEHNSALQFVKQHSGQYNDAALFWLSFCL